MFAILPFFAVIPTPPALPPEAAQFDFWIGDWDCEGPSYGLNGTASQTKGQNHIDKILDGRVVQEHFSMLGLVGSSFSTFGQGKWRQTWVDDQGGYIPLSGGFADGKMTLQTLKLDQSSPNASRMVYLNIQKDSFDWRWESTTDGGKSWKLQWLLHYNRRK